MPTRATPPGNGPEQTHVDGVHLQVTRDTDRPSKIACREAVAKRRAQRRTFITRAARVVHHAGGSLRDVQLLAGHRSIQTTQRYIDGDTDAQRKLVSLI